MTMTYGQIESALQAALRATLPDDTDDWIYVADFSDTYVVYSQDGEYFQDDYSMTDDGEISLAGAPTAVQPLTTYVEMGAEAALSTMLESRGLRVGRTPKPTRLPEERSASRVQVVSEPFTYRRDSTDDRGQGVSYFRDLFMRDRDSASVIRLQRHAIEMDDYNKRVAASAVREFDRGSREHDFAYRINPNPTAGSGGYFNPPAWLIEDAATYPRPKRVLANLVNYFPLPLGASSVNIPVMVTGNSADTQTPGTGNDSSDVTDSDASCNAITISSIGDVSIQLLEMGPVSGATDHAWFKDMSEAYDADLELQLVAGLGGTGPSAQILGLYNVSGITNVVYTSASPTGIAMYPLLGQAAASIGKKRGLPPYAWLMPTSRWSWLVTSEDSNMRPLEFPDLNGSGNAQCPGAIAGWPVWLDDAIPRTFTTPGTPAGGTQDTVIGCIPQDIYLFEGNAVSQINVETLSGNLQARFTYRNYAAAITNRYPSGISVLSGTGMVPVSNY